MVTLELPWPPSTNRLWRQGKAKGSVYLNPKYRAWRKEADVAIIQARRDGLGRVAGRFTATVVLDQRKRRSNTDVDNRLKATMDALQRMLVIDDDALADSISVSWGEANGVKITVVPCQ